MPTAAVAVGGKTLSRYSGAAMKAATGPGIVTLLGAEYVSGGFRQD